MYTVYDTSCSTDGASSQPCLVLLRVDTRVHAASPNTNSIKRLDPGQYGTIIACNRARAVVAWNPLQECTARHLLLPPNGS